MKSVNSKNIFQSKLRGMHEHSAPLSLPSAGSDVKTVTEKLYQTANLLQVVSLSLSLFIIISLLTGPKW